MALDNSPLMEGRGPGRPKEPWEPSPRDLEVYYWVCRGYSTRKIGEKFNLHHSRVCQIRDAIDDWLTPQWMDHIRRVKARQTNTLNMVIREAFDAWDESKKNAETESVKTGTGKDGTGTERTKTVKRQCGNPAFLSEIRAALADIRKIWGADAPVASADDTDAARIAGRPREDVIREQIGLLSAVLEPSDN